MGRNEDGKSKTVPRAAKTLRKPSARMRFTPAVFEKVPMPRHTTGGKRSFSPQFGAVPYVERHPLSVQSSLLRSSLHHRAHHEDYWFGKTCSLRKIKENHVAARRCAGRQDGLRLGWHFISRDLTGTRAFLTTGTVRSSFISSTQRCHILQARQPV